MRKRQNIKTILSRVFNEPIVKIGIYVLILLFTLMVGVLLTERATNEKLQTLFDALWYTLVTITTVGYGDISPATPLGRLLGIGILLLGVATFATVSGKVASSLFDHQLKRNKGLLRLKKMNKHFVICGWKPDFELIIDGVLEANPDFGVNNIVLINTATESQMGQVINEKRFRGIHYIHGDFTDDTVLRKANIKTASRALILSDHSSDFSTLEIDSRTVLTVLTIENINPKIYVAAELIDSKFEKHLSLAHCDEIILSADYERNLIVCASSGTGISHVLKELMTKSSDEGIGIENFPNEYVGKTFSALDSYYKTVDKPKILIGIIENTGNFYHRRKEALSDAQKNPNIQKVIDELKKVKRLSSNKPILVPNPEYILKPNSKAIVINGNEGAENE